MLDLINLLGFGNFDRPTGPQWFNKTPSHLQHFINISNQPAWLARPLYGYAAPIIILITVVTNSFIVLVLSNKNLRTPTNNILLSMAVTELMTGLSSSPWFLYYYTFGGFRVDEEQGLSPFWCHCHQYFAVQLPTIFHTAAIWLTVFLAIQRYIIFCHPAIVNKYCCPKRTKQIIVYICIISCLSELPVMVSEYSVSVPLGNNSRTFCVRKDVEFIDKVFGTDTYKAMILCIRAFMVHILPCGLLIVYTALLFKTINRADRKRSVQQVPMRKNTTTCLTSPSRLMHATTRMLVVVIGIFLLIEIPLAFILITHLLVVFYGLLDSHVYKTVNNLLIIRNFLIILTYPLNFAIYFGMSTSFKLQFRQLFTRKALYIAKPVDFVGWRPRFSVQLIDIHKLRRPSRAFRRSLNGGRLSMAPFDFHDEQL